MVAREQESEGNRRAERRLARSLGSLLAVLGFVVPLVFCRLGLDAHHDGIVFKPALDFAQGRMVFRDTFSQYGALTVLLQAGAIRLFGEALLSIRILTAIFYGASLVVFGRVWLRLLPPWLTLLIHFAGIVLAPYLVYLFLPWSSVYALFFEGLALLLAVRFAETERLTNLFWAGIAAAATHWCRQPVGIFLVLGLTVGLLAMPLARDSGNVTDRNWKVVFRSLGIFWAGFSALSGALILWLAVQGALADWWKQSFLFAYQFGAQHGGQYSIRTIIHALLPTFSERGWGLVALLAAVQCAVSLARSVARRPSTVKDRIVLLAGVVAVSSWPQFFPVTCVSHCYWAGIPMLGVAARFLLQLHRGRARVARVLAWVTAGGLALQFFADASIGAGLGLEKLRSHVIPLPGIPALRGLRVSSAHAPAYLVLADILAEYGRTHPAGTVVTTTQDALYPALLHRQAQFHPMHVNWGRSVQRLYPDAELARRDYIRRAGPLVVGSSSLLGLDRVGRIWNDTVDVLVPAGSIPRDLFTVDPANSPADGDVTVRSRRDALLRSVDLELVNGDEIVPWYHQSVERMVGAGAPFRIRATIAHPATATPSEAVLVSMCLGDGTCQRRAVPRSKN